MRFRKLKFVRGLVVSGALILSACSSSSGGSDPELSVTNEAVDAFVANYATIVLASYEDTVEGAINLNDAIDTFLDDTTSNNFDDLQVAWRASREPYGQTEVYRFYNGPIDNEDDGPEGFINSWPLSEAYIDYVQGDATAGIINDTDIELTQENLLLLNTQDSETSVSTGYHAIEFLLWGQDLNAAPTDAGLRAFTDYVTTGGGTNSNQDRRGTYLNILGDLLVDQLVSVEDQWEEDAENYRAELLSVSREQALRRIIIGIGSLSGGELAGERMAPALETLSQEDEHSCFSDNTHRDLLNNLQGILNVYYGTYTRVDTTIEGDGTGLGDLIELVNPALNTELQGYLTVAQTKIDEIVDLAEDGTAFDQQISDGADSENGDRIQDAIEALMNFNDGLSEAAADLGVDIS